MTGNPVFVTHVRQTGLCRHLHPVNASPQRISDPFYLFATKVWQGRIERCFCLW